MFRNSRTIRILSVLGVILSLSLSLFAQSSGRTVKSKVQPSYPELAKRMNVTGSVKVEVVVLPNGSVKSAKALGGHPLLIDAAVSAAKQFKYETATGETTETIVFNFGNAG